MAAGDWGAGSALHPLLLTFHFDTSHPVNITAIDVNYVIALPSGQTETGFLSHVFNPVEPVSQGLNAISTAVNAAMTAEGLPLG